MNDELRLELISIGQSYVEITNAKEKIDFFKRHNDLEKEKELEEKRITEEYSLSCAKQIGLRSNRYDSITLDFDIIEDFSMVSYTLIRFLILTVLNLLFCLITIFFKDRFIGNLEPILYVNVSIMTFCLFALIGCLGLSFDVSFREHIFDKRYIKKNKQNIKNFINKCQAQYYIDLDSIEFLIPNTRENIQDNFAKYIYACYRSQFKSDLVKYKIKWNKCNIEFSRDKRNTFLTFLIEPKNISEFYSSEYIKKVNYLSDLNQGLEQAKNKQKRLFNNLVYVPKKYAQNEETIQNCMQVFIDTRPSSWNELIRTYEERVFRDQQIKDKNNYYANSLNVLQNYAQAQNDLLRERNAEYKKQREALEDLAKKFDS